MGPQDFVLVQLPGLKAGDVALVVRRALTCVPVAVHVAFGAPVRLHPREACGELVGDNTLALGRSVLYHNDAHWESHYLERVGRVTSDDVMAIAQRDLQSPAVVLAVEPGA